MEKLSAKARQRAATIPTAAGTTPHPARSVLGLALAFAAAMSAWAVSPSASAQSPSPSSTSPPPDQEWTVRDTQGFRSRNLSIGPLMQMRIDGSTLSPAKSSFKRTSTDRAENQSALDFEAEYSRQNITVRREMRVDPKRRAVRIIDVITNAEAQERNMRVDYSTSLSDRGSVRYGGVLNQAGESREYGNGVPDDTVAAVVFAERQDSQALPLFVWGQLGARWSVNVQDVGSSVSLSYEGVIPAGGKVALLHWVAVAGLDKGVKLERTADAFWKDGRLVNPMVSAEIAPLVVNFTPEALKAASVAQPAALVQPAGRLVHLDKLCGKLSIAREAKDVLWMGKDEQLRGDVTGTTVEVKMEGRTVKIPLADIAGIRGGGGRGREHRVYLRNGAVLTGRASLGECRLAGELGNLTLDADALELLLLRVGEEDGKVPKGVSGFIELQNGAVYWLARQEGAALQYVTVFGGFPISLSEIWLLERRTEPPFNLIATLADGSRIHGVAQQPTLSLPVRDADGKTVPTQVRVAEMARFGSSELLAKEMALPVSGSPPTEDISKPKSEPPARYCWLRDGSLLVGAITSPTLRVRAGGNEVELKSEDIARMAQEPGSGDLASIELRSGAKMQGELLSESFEWQLGRQKVSLPASWVQEVVRKELATTPGEASTGENNPVALPKGVAKEDLVEMKVEYPKAVAEGPLRVWGTLSLPRLDKCDEESVKKRLTFLVPKGTTNVALKKPVTVSAPGSALGVLTNITDGSARDDGGEQVALEGGLQWMQIDLGEAHHIWKVLLWHYHRMPVVYQDVIVMVSNDPDFHKDVKVIFNNDHDNSSGLGAGPDIAYVETNYGYLMDGANAQGRYIRFYSHGNSYSEKNDYLEAMVFGTPQAPKGGAPGKPAPNDPLALPKGMKLEELVEEKPQYPNALFIGVPVPAGDIPKLEKPTPELVKARSTFLIPKGAVNVARGKKVTSSDTQPIIGTLDLVTNGDAAGGDGCYVELAPGLQWVQIDLGASHHIWKVLLWHFHKQAAVYHDVIVQVSDDPVFKTGVQTIFNNDVDDSAGFGKGLDPTYVETNRGKLMDGSGAKGRYVRFYSKGNTANEMNHYIEANVYGTPVTAKVATPSPALPGPTTTPSLTTTPAPATPKAAAAPPSAATNKPNDPDRMPTGFTREQMVTRHMSVHTRVPPMGFFLYNSASKFPHLDKSAPPVIPKDGQVPVKVTYPKGGDNVSQGKNVTSSVKPTNPFSLRAFTDSGTGINSFVELPKGLQWMQIDLGARYSIWKILLWHYYQKPYAVADLIVQVSDDEQFSDGVTTIFNSDHDNSVGMGRGADAAYMETPAGKVIDGCDARGRYVRFYSNGSSEGDVNRFTEAMVFGTKVEPEAAAAGAAPARETEQAPEKVTLLMPKYPKPTFLSGPVEVDAKLFPHFEKPDPEAVKARLSFEIPSKVSVIFTPKPVTSSVELAKPDDLRRVSNGTAEIPDLLELPGGLQWVQLDLGEPHKLSKLLLWHRFDKTNLVYHDVVVQAGMDPEFKKEVTTLFNNDHDDSAKLGKGSDPAYLETNHGRLIEGKETLARYVRFYSRGNSQEDKNHYSEVTVIGAKAEGAAKPGKAPETAAPEKISPAPAMPATPAPGAAPAPVTLSTKPTPAQLASTAAHQRAIAPMVLPPGIPESELIVVRPLLPKGSPVPSVIRSTNKLEHQEEHQVEALKDTMAIRVPKGTLRVSAGKPVATSDSTQANSKDLAYVTDGHVRMQMSPFLSLAEGLQCVQIDLQAPHRIWKVLLWHDVTRFDVYEDVIVQLSSDPEFAKEVVTIFNNDIDNTSGMGKGPDPAYIETYFGRLMDGGGHTARYVRFYSRGNTTDGKNCYLEAAVFGTRVGVDEKATPEPNEPMPTVANNPLAPVKKMIADANITITPAYPKPMYVTAPVIPTPPDTPHLEKVDPQVMKERMSFEVQRWSYNLAKRKTVTSSAPPLVEGSLARLVDEDANAKEENLVTLPAGTQWVQIDLGMRSRIWKVLLWHAHNEWNVAHDVLVQVSEDPTFASGVQTIFNNDHDNSAGLGKGADPAYVETSFGRLIDGCGARGRYLRVTSRGSTASPLNRFAEVLVYGKPTPYVGPGESFGEAPPPLAEVRAKEDVNPYSDTVRTLPMYPEPAPDAPPFGTVSVDAARFPHLEKRDWIQEHTKLDLRGPLRGFSNIAKYKTVTASAPNIPEADLQRATNGAEFFDDVLELPSGLQWVQVDLGSESRVWNVVLWHNHRRPMVYQDVVVQVSSDPKFATDVTTVFNNDHDNSSGLGKGQDPAYVETHFGRNIDAGGALGRYVRFYSNGNSENGANHFCEAWVYGGREPGMPGADDRETVLKSASYPTPPPGLVYPEGRSVGYSRESSSYTLGYASAGPFSVQRKDFPHLEPFDYERERSLLSLPYPNGVTVLRGQSFSSSTPLADSTDLRRFADSSVSPASDVVLPGGLQWMQVDLGKVHELWYLRLWHHINDLVVYQDVVVQASEDPDFKTGVVTLFNNDHDNSSGLGKGTDPAYLETQFGRLIPGLGIRARYLRVYSRGNSREDVNRFAEIKVYGREPKRPLAPRS